MKPEKKPAPSESHKTAAPLPARRSGMTGWMRRWVFTTRHREIGIQYLVLALVAVVAGTLLSLLMRIHLVWPEITIPFFGPIKPEDYLALVTMHGTLMVFFVLTTAPQSGFANLVMPDQIGAPEEALLSWETQKGPAFSLGSSLFCLRGRSAFLFGGEPVSIGGG